MAHTPSSARKRPSILDIPGPAGTLPVGVLPQLRRDPLHFAVQAAREYGDMVRLNLGIGNLILLNHPELIEHVIQKNHRNYRKSVFYKRLKPLFGEGMLIADGAEWKSQRAAAKPAFVGEIFKTVAETAGALTGELAESWCTKAATGDLEQSGGL